MSLDIDWSLLSSSSLGPDSLSQSFVTLLNRTLTTVNRPSFLGPIEVTHFSFGDVGPEVEIKDIGDVWRAFEEDDDDDEDVNAHRDDGEESGWRSADRGGMDSGGSSIVPKRRRKNYIPDEVIGGEDWDYINRRAAKAYKPPASYYPDEEDDTASVFSGMMSPRVSMQRFAGAGMGIGLGAGMGVNLGVGLNSGLLTPGLNGLNPSILSQTLSNPHPLHPLRPSQRHRDSQTPEITTPVPESPTFDPSPPASTALPSLQLLLHLSHSPNITLTLLTSLQINYPSPSFMSLPLKLSLTGFTLCADIVLALEGPKRRIHISLIDEHDPFTPAPSLSAGASATTSSAAPSLPSTPGQTHPSLRGFAPINPLPPPEPPKPIGQRLLPNLQIESEIGYADGQSQHVLRNVGKVEKFIGDVVRKFLCDELVFPNYQTVAM